MAAPTRAQIEGTIVQPKYKVEILGFDSAWHQILDARVIDISGNVESTTNINNGVSFGSPSAASADLEMEDNEVYSSIYTSNEAWINQPVRISYGYDTSDFIQVFYGPVQSITVSNHFVKMSLGGIEQFIANVKLHSPIYYRRLVATKTTTLTEENPDNLPVYSAGLLNYALWMSGGRPYEQKDIIFTEASTGFKFWYSCDWSILAPDFAWFSGANTLEEIYALVRASGGQLYQDNKGVLRYASPTSLGDTTTYGSYFTFDDGTFVDYEKTITAVEKLDVVKLTYTPRYVGPEQQVIEDTQPRFFAPSETKVIELAPQQPVWSYVGLLTFDDSTATKTMHATLLNNADVTPTIGAVITNAQNVQITVTNPSATFPMILHDIKIKGRALLANEEATLSYGTGPVERNIENNVYIQSEDDAQRFLRMIYDFYVESRPVITLSGVQFDTDRFVGELVQFSSQYNVDVVGTVYRIIKIGYNIGTSMDISMVSVATLKKRPDFFIIGTSYSGATVRELGY